MLNKLKAVNHYVIVEVIVPEMVTEGGIILGGASLTGSLKKGRVVSVGPKVTVEDHGVIEGDVIAFHDGHGEKVEGRDDIRVINAIEIRYILKD